MWSPSSPDDVAEENRVGAPGDGDRRHSCWGARTPLPHGLSSCAAPSGRPCSSFPDRCTYLRCCPFPRSLPPSGWVARRGYPHQGRRADGGGGPSRVESCNAIARWGSCGGPPTPTPIERRTARGERGRDRPQQSVRSGAGSPSRDRTCLGKANRGVSEQSRTFS